MSINKESDTTSITPFILQFEKTNVFRLYSGLTFQKKKGEEAEEEKIPPPLSEL